MLSMFRPGLLRPLVCEHAKGRRDKDRDSLFQLVPLEKPFATLGWSNNFPRPAHLAIQ